MTKIQKIRKKILIHTKLQVVKYGWNANLFYRIVANSNITQEQLNSLFPNGYQTIIEMYLDEINEEMTFKAKNLDLIRLRVHQRIRELILLRLKIFSKNKELISKTFIYLLSPRNYKFSLKCLYKTVDQIWFLSGDSSTDFNFYSKRIILASIYTTIMIHYTNNDNLDKTILLLDKQLKRVSKIPKIKNVIKNSFKFFPKIIKLKKKFS